MKTLINYRRTPAVTCIEGVRHCFRSFVDDDDAAELMDDDVDDHDYDDDEVLMLIFTMTTMMIVMRARICSSCCRRVYLVFHLLPPTHSHTTPRPRLSTVFQAFLIGGLMVLAFELFAVPNLTPRLGVRMSQRLGSAFEIPVYVLIPLLSCLNGAKFPASLVAVILLFTCYVTSNAVSTL